MIDLFGEEEHETRKNFSRNNVGQRRAGDFYQTPPSMTRQFLDVLPVSVFPVLEPARGKGAIEQVLRAEYLGKDVTAYDIAEGIDFLKEPRQFPEIITNPPFSLSVEFILKCKEVATSRFSLLIKVIRLSVPVNLEHLSEQEIKAIEADILIFNNGTIDELYRKIDSNIHRLLGTDLAA